MRKNFENMHPEVSNEYVGEEYEEAYAEVLGGEVQGGEHDHGRDIIGIPDVGAVQVKASFEGAKAFLRESLKRRRFIPLVVGEPGTREEMIDSIKEFGAWIGNEIPGREEKLKGIAEVREMCSN